MGDFDEFNPRFVMEQKYTKTIISLISVKPPFYYDFDKLLGKLNTDKKTLQYSLNLLKNISAIDEKSDCFCLNFPFFLDCDIKTLQLIIFNLLNKNKNTLLNKIEGLKDKLFELYPNIKLETSLYHLLCGKIFDGLMFDYLEEKGLLKQSYIQKDNRDYMLIGYQNSHKCNKFNADLFCSFNNAKYLNNSLTSFGNASGERLDYFRYFKCREKNNIHGKFAKIHSHFQDEANTDIVKNSLSNILDLLGGKQISDNKYLEVLKFTNYVDKSNNIIVPIFDNYIVKINKLYEEVKKELGPIITDILNEFKIQILASNITCLKHNVPIEQLCNELWHTFFGLLNKFLIKEKIVATPQQFFKQGKYLKCIYLSNDNEWHKDIVKEILNKEKIPFENITKATSGFTNLVYFVDDKFVIKMSNDTEIKKKLEKEIAVYKNIKLSFMPTFITCGNLKDYQYLIISKLSGKSLYSIWHTFSNREKQSCVKQIAKILKEFNNQDYNFLSEEYKHLDWTQYLSKELKAKSQSLTELGFDTTDLDTFISNDFDKLFKDNTFGLIYNDAHFDNFIYDNGLLSLIDFDRVGVYPIDYEMLIFKTMCDFPSKFASEKDEANIKIEDYTKIYEQFRAEYPEMFKDKNVGKRIAIYQFNYLIGQAIECKNYEWIKELLNDLLS